MEFARSEMQTMLLDGAARLLSKNGGVEYWRGLRSGEDGFERARWLQFAELGWLALPLPESAGGLDGSVEDVLLLNIELGRALATEPFVSSVVTGGHILAGSASPSEAAAALGGIACGELLVALAHHEAGADPIGAEAPGTNARREGDGYRLNGAKPLVADGARADRFIVSATVDGEDGTALFLVGRDAEGVAVEAYPLIDGTRAADVTMTEVLLPATALLAGGNAGAALLDEAIDRASIALMAQAVGSIEACLELSGAYAKERRQFGAAIGSFQAVQHLLADMFVAAQQARSILYHAASCSADPKGRAAAVSAARIVVGEASQLVSRNGIQVHGGYGLTDEYAISHYYRRLMVFEKQYGGIDRHLRRFADHVLPV